MPRSGLTSYFILFIRSNNLHTFTYIAINTAFSSKTSDWRSLPELCMVFYKKQNCYLWPVVTVLFQRDFYDNDGKAKVLTKWTESLVQCAGYAHRHVQEETRHGTIFISEPPLQPPECLTPWFKCRLYRLRP